MIINSRANTQQQQKIKDIKNQGGIAAVSGTPLAAINFKEAIIESKADIFFLQATVVSTEHIGKEGNQNLDLFL